MLFEGLELGLGVGLALDVVLLTTMTGVPSSANGRQHDILGKVATSAITAGVRPR